MIFTRTIAANESVGTSHEVPPKRVQNFGKGGKFS